MRRVKISGEFELHVTVAGDTDLARLQMFADVRGLKLTHVVLDRGKTPSQPMLTKQVFGDEHSARADAKMIASQLRTDGFSVVRVKVESSPFNAGVPRTDDDARVLFPGHYFEHHFKLLLAPGECLETLRAQTEPLGGHLSRNARRVRTDGAQERFVTQRCFDVGQTTSQASFDRLLDALSGRTVLESESEFVVYDDHVALDRGWIQENGEGEARG